MGGFVSLVEHRPRGGGATYRSWKSLRASIKQFERERDKPIIAGTRRGLRKAWREAALDFVSRGVGRRFWGGDVTARGRIGRGSNLRTFFRERRIRRVGERFQTGFTLQGFAQLVEQGGRIRAHDIPRMGKRARKNRARREAASGQAELLSFTWRGRPVVFRSVRHPGATVQRRPFAEPSLQRNEGAFRQFVEEALLKQWDQAIERNG